MHNYLIPANTKKGKLIMGLFTSFDLILFGTGILLTFLLLAFMPLSSTVITIFCLLPAFVTGFLVFPIPYYHNMMTILGEMYNFYKPDAIRCYIWKGWCYRYGKKK